MEYSRDLAKKYNADIEAVWLAAILHDISRLDHLEPHDEIGAKKAYDLLKEKGFDEEIAKKVHDIIFTHRCKNHMPETLEQKILATADAVSHFKTPFYLWWEHINNFGLRESFESGAVKIERDFNDKIFFDEEKESVRKEYEVLKNWFKYGSKIKFYYK